MRSVQGVTFDLFDTLVTIEAGALPTLDCGGVAVPSTAPVLWDVVRRRHADVEVGRFIEELLRAAGDAQAEIAAAGLVEVPAHRHFEPLIRRLGLSHDASDLAHLLVETHMRAIAAAARPMAGAGALLQDLRAGGARIALVSNLDFPPAAAWILDGAGLSGRFDAIVLSGEVGFKKPHGRIFQIALERLGLDASQVVHVGDHAVDDVEGGARAGLATVWVTGAPGGAVSSRAPTWTVLDLAELRQRLPLAAAILSA